ncbi:MAG: septum formation protein Maf [Spirochaetes bacterium]|nr:septum formation protein Maf [Spirochaetota bacterium]
MSTLPILGSASPRRKSILEGLFGEIRVIHPALDEARFPGESPEDFSTRVSREKSAAVIASLSSAFPGGRVLVITADTVVAIDGRVLGKPRDLEDAIGMIAMLGGRTHRVITGLTLAAVEDSGRVSSMTGYDTTHVTFRSLEEREIRRYLSLIDYRDKAGAYAFQEHGAIIVEGYRGSATNIIGLPLRLLFSMLSTMGIAGEVFG